MKKLLFIAFSLISLSWFSCKKVQELTQFDLNYSSEITIPSSTGLNLPFAISTPDISSNIESEFSVKNTNKDLIEKITLKSLNLKITNPTEGNFDFLKSVEIYIKAEGLDPVLIASKNNIQDGLGKNLSLDVTQTDIKDYIKKSKFGLEVKSVTDKLITKDHTLKVDAVFFVDAKVLGL